MTWSKLQLINFLFRVQHTLPAHQSTTYTCRLSAVDTNNRIPNGDKVQIVFLFLINSANFVILCCSVSDFYMTTLSYSYVHMEHIHCLIDPICLISQLVDLG